MKSIKTLIWGRRGERRGREGGKGREVRKRGGWGGRDEITDREETGRMGGFVTEEERRGEERKAEGEDDSLFLFWTRSWGFK